MSAQPTNAFDAYITAPGLTIHVNAGTLFINGALSSVAAADVALTASATNYVYVDLTTGLITVSTSAFPAFGFPIATVVTDTVGIKAGDGNVADKRPDFYNFNTGVTGATLASPTITGTATTELLRTTVANSAADVGSNTNFAYDSELSLTAASITAGSIGAIRGIATLPSGKSILGGVFLSGIRGGLVIAGTMNHADSRLSGAFIKLDISAATLTAGQLNGVWIDLGTTGTGTGGGQFNLLRLQNTTQAVPNAHIYMYGSASFIADLNSGAFTPGILSLTGSAGSSTGKGWIKIKVDGATRYIAITDSVS